MPTTPVKFNSFSTDLTNGKHDFSTHAFKIMLTNTAPVATNTAKANITEIAAGNGYTAGGATTTISKSNTSGVETLVASDVSWTAATGSMATFQYAVLYNDTQTTPAKPVVCWWDHGSGVSLAVSQTYTIDMDPTNGFGTVG